MSTNNENPCDSPSNATSLSPNMEPKRKVSILADAHPQAYDNPAFDGPANRKISTVSVSEKNPF